MCLYRYTSRLAWHDGASPGRLWTCWAPFVLGLAQPHQWSWYQWSGRDCWTVPSTTTGRSPGAYAWLYSCTLIWGHGFNVDCSVSKGCHLRRVWPCSLTYGFPCLSSPSSFGTRTPVYRQCLAARNNDCLTSTGRRRPAEFWCLYWSAATWWAIPCITKCNYRTAFCQASYRDWCSYHPHGSWCRWDSPSCPSLPCWFIAAVAIL